MCNRKCIKSGFSFGPLFALAREYIVHFLGVVKIHYRMWICLHMRRPPVLIRANILAEKTSSLFKYVRSLPPNSQAPNQCFPSSLVQQTSAHSLASCSSLHPFLGQSQQGIFCKCCHRGSVSGLWSEQFLKINRLWRCVPFLALLFERHPTRLTVRN